MLRTLAMCAAIGAAAVTVRAAELPREIADCHIYKIWQFDTSVEGWVADHNVSRFTVKDGILSFRNTGTDPWILNSQIGGPDTADYHFLGIKMRSSAPGANQIYFATDRYPISERTVVHYQVSGDGRFHFYEVDLSQLETWSGAVKLIRIDPVNGTGEQGAQIDIDWIALYQVPARLMPGRPYAGTDDKGVFISLPITNVGGLRSSDALVVRCGEDQQKPGAIQPRETKTVLLRAPAGSADLHVRAEMEGKTLLEATLVSPLDEDSAAAELANTRTVVTFPLIRPMNRARISAVDGERRIAMGVLRPLATLAYKGKDGVVRYLEVSPETHELTADGSTAMLSAQRQINGGVARFAWLMAVRADGIDVPITCSMKCDEAIDVLRFEGPRLLAGEGSFGAGKTHALFPGLEYLEKDEPSSAVKHIGPKFADRRVPHPYKITVPLMAVESNSAVVGISWDPLAPWAGKLNLPCAQFESPARCEGAANHLMTVFAPSIPSYVRENREFASEPYTLLPGDTISISARYFACAGTSLEEVIPDYYRAHGLPEPPPAYGGVDRVIDTCFAAYTGSLYQPAQNAWKSHIAMGEKPSFRPAYAAIVLGESLRRGDPKIARQCKIAPGTQLTQYLGTTMDWFSEGARHNMEAALARQLPDGGFPYTIDDDMIRRVKELAEIGGSDQTTLGEVGSTNSGLTVVQLSGVLDYGLRTGSQKFIQAGLKGLARLNSFSVPRGAQTWEVHAHTPDVYAAGLAVDANILGYRITGDDRYLDRARFWAYTGIPFAYGWTPPIDPVPKAVFHMDQMGEGKVPVLDQPSVFYEDVRRRINPGATIPVFGTSFYVGSWFGVPVQWCGLAWANAAMRYLRVLRGLSREDAVLRAVADAVFASGTQQQFDKGWLAGTYPDSWNLIENQVNQAFIAPDLILDYAYALKQEKRPYSIETAAFDLKGARACLSSYGRIEEFSLEGGSVEAALKWYANQDLYTCVAPVDPPAAVSLDQKALSGTSDLTKAGRGYYYDPENRALHVKFRPQGRSGRLRIEW